MKTKEEVLAKIKELEALKAGAPTMNCIVINQQIAILRWVVAA